METKQTAIEWVEDELSNLNNLISNTRMTFEEYHKIRIEIWVKAKQMEKEQIEEAYNNGGEHYTEYGKAILGEDYYNERYGN